MKGQTFVWPFLFPVTLRLPKAENNVERAGSRLRLPSEQTPMTVRTAANEQILTWMADIPEREVSDGVADISALATEYAALLFRVAFSVLRNASDAEDAVQETFLRVMKHRSRLGRIQDKKVWLARVAWNVAIDRKRRLRAVPEHNEAEELLRNYPAEGHDADARMRDAESCVRILRMMEKLPRKEGEVLRLSAMEELSTAEIAAVLGTTESSVRARLFRARHRLRERMESDGRRGE